MATKKTEVATIEYEANEIELYADEFDVGETGLENVQISDLLTPRLRIVQSLSNQRKKSSDKYIEGAEEGDICDVSLGRILGTSIYFIPVYWNKCWIERENKVNGNFVDVHYTPAALVGCRKDDKGYMINEDGNQVVETDNVYGYSFIDERRFPCVISLQRSQIGMSKKLNTYAANEVLQRKDGTTFKAPFWFRVYVLSTKSTNNDEGDWFIWQVERSVSLPEISSILPSVTDWKAINSDAQEFLKKLKEDEQQLRADVATISDTEETM